MSTAILNSGFFNSQEHLNEEGISLYTDALILGKKEELPSEILDHVENCQLCKNKIIELYGICKDNSLYNTVTHPYFHEAIKQQFNYSILYKIAASVLILVSIVLITKFLFRNQKKEIIISEEQCDSSSVKHDKIISDSIGSDQKEDSEHDHIYIAANFNSNPVFESLIDESLRSDNILKIISPQTDQQFSLNKSIKFKWESESIENLKIIILNNRADRIIEIEDIIGNNATYNKELKPGLYYWKLESEDDLLYLGKFIVK